MTTENIFQDAKGNLTNYALKCGYVQKVDTPDIHKEIYMEHSHYHVRSIHNNTPEFHSVFDGPTSHIFVIWEVFDTLKEARRLYNAIK